MSWYPGATRMELQPESDSQAAIRPTQFIMHSIAAPWTEQRIYEYWRDSTNLESHFGLAFDGDLGQFIGTQTRADANAQANRRGDGTGAVSIETASNLQHTDPWTDAQMASLIRLGVWLHREHGIPLRVCRSWDDPGFGYHRLFSQWSVGGTACPGDARVRQFREVVFPGIVAAASGAAPLPSTPGPTPTPTPARRKKMALVSKTMPAVEGDGSATTFTVVPGEAWLNVSADFVAPGEQVTIRYDVSDGSGAWIQQGEVIRVGNGQMGNRRLPGSGIRVLSVKRLDHPDAVVDVTVHYPEA